MVNNNRHKNSIVSGVSTFLVLFVNMSAALAQEPTPLQIEIITATPVPVDLSTPTPTFTPSPEVQSAAQLQAKQSAGEVNVRDEADIEGELLGQIRYGDQYVVTGRYYSWYQFRYPLSPNGLGWVYGELVDIIGEESRIPDLAQLPQPTTDPNAIAATENVASLLLTPGAVLTATANSREIQGPVAVVAAGNDTQPEVQQTALPTFTHPPNIALLTTEVAESGAALTAPTQQRASIPERTPPIVPILILGGFGMLGLIVSAMRR